MEDTYGRSPGLAAYHAGARPVRGARLTTRARQRPPEGMSPREATSPEQGPRTAPRIARRTAATGFPDRVFP